MQTIDYARLVLGELKRIKKDYTTERKRIEGLRAEKLKIKQRTDLLRKLLELEGKNVEAA